MTAPRSEAIDPKDPRLEKPYTLVTTYKSLFGFWTTDTRYLWPDQVPPWIQDTLNTIEANGDRIYSSVTLPRHAGGSDVWMVNSKATWWQDTDDM